MMLCRTVAPVTKWTCLVYLPFACCLAGLRVTDAQADPALLPMVAPDGNPMTEEKALLGKFLFWEEQLSSDDSVACGTCHIPEAGGTDPRSLNADSIHPGADGRFQTSDDVRGSLGVARQNDEGEPIRDDLFEDRRQVTPRRSPSTIGAGYAPNLLWDGHATGEFFDPETDELVISSGAALERQALLPILSDVEMGHVGRTWEDVRHKLRSVTPLALASELPADLREALQEFPTYPELFRAAYGTENITARRIAFAIATYERTLVPDQTPYDRFARGEQGALSDLQQRGLRAFLGMCNGCHDAPLFSDHRFSHTGVRPVVEDPGRAVETGLDRDRGAFKVPSLRNVKLRAPYFHDGSRADLSQVLDFYSGTGGSFLIDRPRFPERERAGIVEFLREGLTDPRVAAGRPPFDHPRLQSFFKRGDADRDDRVDLSDAVLVLELLFVSSGRFPCADAADADDSGEVNVTDAVVILGRVFLGGGALPSPGDRTPGPDRTNDALDCRRAIGGRS